MLPDIFQQEHFIIEKRNLTRQKNKRTKTNKKKTTEFFYGVDSSNLRVK